MLQLPDKQELPPESAKLMVERAHRIVPRAYNNPSTPMLIINYFNFREKELVMRAAKTNGEVAYKNSEVLPGCG